MTTDENILDTSPTYTDVEGAPVKINQQVQIKTITDLTALDDDDNGEHDDVNALIDALIGQKGHVVYLEYNGGCGQVFPKEPMIGVKLDSGKTLELWYEELQTIT